MRLRSGGLDVFYIDESNDRSLYVLSAVSVPFLRNHDGVWTITWPVHLEGAKAWRRRIKDSLHIPTTKELHGVTLVSGRGAYHYGRWRLKKPRAAAVYRRVLETVDFLPDASIMCAAAKQTARLYGGRKLQAALHALFQRMRTQCNARQTNAIVFFDEGHPEYRKLYRQSQVYLPTGSAFGGWDGGMYSKNLPLDMFTKDANEKNSKHCYFTQLADLVAYAAFLKVKGETGRLEEWQHRYNLGTLYSAIPQRLLNVKASTRPPRDAIVRLP